VPVFALAVLCYTCHPERVPAGPNILQLMTYNTDSSSTEFGDGPEHFIRVNSKASSYEPTIILDTLIDYGTMATDANVGAKTDKSPAVDTTESIDPKVNTAAGVDPTSTDKQVTPDAIM
jgi:hypothetical protein